jgi:hypothetical protein
MPVTHAGACGHKKTVIAARAPPKHAASLRWINKDIRRAAQIRPSPGDAELSPGKSGEAPGSGL